MEARAAMTRWTTVVCLLSTGLYALVLPALLPLTPALPLLFAVPPTIIVCCSAAWYSLAVGKLGRARVLCFIPALLFLAIYLVVH